MFSVTDRGPGIPPDVLEKVFDWFETHSLGSHHRGTGIGLSLVRSFVELHGGTVDDRLGGRRRHHRDMHASRSAPLSDRRRPVT